MARLIMKGSRLVSRVRNPSIGRLEIHCYQAAAEAENGRIEKRKRGGGRGRGGRGRGKPVEPELIMKGDDEAKEPGQPCEDGKPEKPARKNRVSKLLKVNPKPSGSSKDRPAANPKKKPMSPKKLKKVQQGLEVVRQANLNGLEVPFELSNQLLAFTWFACYHHDHCLHCCSKLR